MTYDKRHGGPFDRGGADFWYGRGFDPHYYKGATYSTDRVELADMTPDTAPPKKTAHKEWGYE
jgi:hypothetical protein